MKEVGRGEVWWADFGFPLGSRPGFRRPVVVVQSDAFNRRPKLATVVVASVASNLALSKVPGNVRVTSDESGLPRDSVVNVTQLFTIDKADLVELAGELPPYVMIDIDAGLQLVLSLDVAR